MKLIITHLKAPWPLGAVVGDVVELPAVPVWAVGKCQPAGDDAQVTALDQAQPARLSAEEEDALAASAALMEAEAQAAQERAQIKDKAALKEEAEALGLTIDGRLSASKIAELIAAKKAEQE